MAVFNTITKDIIHRFAVETNRLLASSKHKTLREGEVMAAMRMMFRHQPDFCMQVIAQHRQMAANKFKTRGGGGARGGKRGGKLRGSAARGQSNAALNQTFDKVAASPEPSTPPRANPKELPPSRYGEGVSPQPGPSSAP